MAIFGSSSHLSVFNMQFFSAFNLRIIPILSLADSFTKPDDATFDIITDEELNEIEDNDCSLESTNQSSSNLPESELQDASSL